MPLSSSTMRILCMLGRDRGQGGLGNHWQFHDEARSNRLVFLHANRAVMLFDDAAQNRQAESGSAFPSGEIWKKEFFFQLAGYAMAGICNGDFNSVAAGHQRG